MNPAPNKYSRIGKLQRDNVSRYIYLFMRKTRINLGAG